MRSWKAVATQQGPLLSDSQARHQWARYRAARVASVLMICPYVAVFSFGRHLAAPLLIVGAVVTFSLIALTLMLGRCVRCGRLASPRRRRPFCQRCGANLWDAVSRGRRSDHAHPVVH